MICQKINQEIIIITIITTNIIIININELLLLLVITVIIKPPPTCKICSDLFGPVPVFPAQKAALIVFAHQSPASFNATLRDAAVQELSGQGFRVTVSDLYAMNFRASATQDDIIGDPPPPP